MIQSASTIIFMCFVYGKVEKAGTGTGPIRAWALPLPALLSSLTRPWTFTQLLSSCPNPNSERKATLMKHLAVLARPFTVAFIVASHLNVMRLNTIFISINLGGNHHSVEASLTQSFWFQGWSAPRGDNPIIVMWTCKFLVERVGRVCSIKYFRFWNQMSLG